MPRVKSYLALTKAGEQPKPESAVLNLESAPMRADMV